MGLGTTQGTCGAGDYSGHLWGWGLLGGARGLLRAPVGLGTTQGARGLLRAPVGLGTTRGARGLLRALTSLIPRLGTHLWSEVSSNPLHDPSYNS